MVALAGDFSIYVQNRKVVRVDGKVPGNFVGEVKAICHEGKLSAGVVKAVKDGNSTKLVFSDNVPVSVQQRLRNAFALRR